MRIRLRTRLWAAFFVSLAVLAGASALTLVTLERLATIERAAGAAEDAKHHGHKTAALIRDLYIHQTHVVIAGEPPDAERYASLVNEARRSVTLLVSRTEQLGLGTAPVAALPSLIERIAAPYHDVILPARAAGDTAALLSSQALVQELVDAAIAHIEELNGRLEARADDARAEAVSAGRYASTLILSALVGSSVLALILGALLARSITGPLGHLRAAAGRLAAGDRDARLTPRGDRELADLAEAFNRMAEQIARHEKRLVEARRLAGLGRIAAGVAHEINNPLTVVLGRAKLLQERLASEDTSAGSTTVGDLQVIVAEAEQCHKIVADLLSLGQRHSEPPESIDLQQLLEQAVVRARATSSRSDAEDINVKLAMPLSIPHPHAPPGRVRQVVDNLMRNAFEACRSRVVARCFADGGAEPGSMRLEIEDDGRGIPAEDLPRLFEPFFTTKPGGTGLGLAISLAVARSLGGELHAKRADLGGACFVLSLPTDAAGGGRQG